MKERRQNPIFMNFLLHHLPDNAAKNHMIPVSFVTFDSILVRRARKTKK
jgi:hypothetical protein